ncbi:hypothetical protein BpHYR1_000588 [Brachionus plicatilis]|uniref:SWIM-type domain-containing protein n=1 Tax=Brachionus plicatilis TaxID=10195 RepID=A0A3M7RYH1_BRAPC|nr:hypothetical protein BpHYR1_000588 [Brachionus plicatilis]
MYDVFGLRIVKFNTENWIHSTCTCYTYLKEFLCKHILVYDSIIGCIPKPGKRKKPNFCLKTNIFVIKFKIKNQFSFLLSLSKFSEEYKNMPFFFIVV